jgi:hypothetical protein
MATNVAHLVKDIPESGRIVAVLRQILPAPDAAPLMWVRLQEDITAHLGAAYNVRALLILRRLGEAGLVDVVLAAPHAIPEYRHKAQP